MNEALRKAFKVQIEAKKGFDFEEFISRLFLLKYGEDDYVPIRGNKDKGNDGVILVEQKVLACYAPREYKKREFEIKVLGSANKEGDFQKYQKNWQTQYPNWEMYVNHEISPEQLNLVKRLQGNTSIKGTSQILSIIDDLHSSKKRKLAYLLGIDDLFVQDCVQRVVNDLLNAFSLKGESLRFNKKSLVPPQEKIELNYEEEDWDGMHSEMALAMENFGTIERVLSLYNDDEISTLKSRIVRDYNKLSGNLKDKLNNLTEQYAREYKNTKDDEYNKWVEFLLLYMFEQCLIGRKTNSQR